MADQQGARFNRVSLQYTNLAKNFLSRWDTAVNQVRRRRYSTQSMLSDVFASWLDVASLPLTLLSDGATPEIHFDIGANEASALKAIAVTLPADLQIETTNLIRKDKAAPIPQQNVKADLFDGGNVLVVALVDLKALGGLTVGDYGGRVQDAKTGEVVAEISVTVK